MCVPLCALWPNGGSSELGYKAASEPLPRGFPCGKIGSIRLGSQAREERPMHITRLPKHLDTLAPDQTEIRLLVSLERGSSVHCTLQPGQTSLAGKHRTVEEIWYTLQGQGEIWLKRGELEREEAVSPGSCVGIPPDTSFQVRNTSASALCFLIVTLPPWPGEQEWVRVADHWLTP
jgi:mannose-6-phosphate isomerase-like protein (cupin superfamily)